MVNKALQKKTERAEGAKVNQEVCKMGYRKLPVWGRLTNAKYDCERAWIQGSPVCVYCVTPIPTSDCIREVQVRDPVGNHAVSAKKCIDGSKQNGYGAACKCN